VGLVYDPRGLSGVMTARPGVAVVLQPRGPSFLHWYQEQASVADLSWGSM
jgi:hypothetical protein